MVEKQKDKKALAEKAVEIGGKGLSDEQREVFYHALEVISSILKEVSREGLPKPIE